jgi:hypothetical protein
MGTGAVSSEGSARVALREMRAARRRRYVQQLDVMEVLYRVYVGAIFAAIALGVVAGAVNEAPATPAAIDSLRRHGPALLGMAIAACIFAGLRAGARGGPLAIEEAELQYVLLAPVDRGAALRPAAWRQLRIGALAGAVLGAVLGNFVFRRLPGSPVEWIACLALFGALVPACVLTGALLASGRRLRPLVAAATGVLLLAWSGADLALGWSSSPATMLGDLATLPLQSGGRVGLAALGVAVAVALVAVGLFGIGGILLEAARRRASLTAELRFSASVQDLRTVVLLRRQLASERPRRRPWVRLGVGGAGRHPIWRRDWQSFLRWPAARVARAVLLGVLTGAVMVGAWSGATPAFFVPGLLLFVAALDFVEPLAQESDHPTRRQLLPFASSSLMPRHLAAPAAAIAAVIVVAAVAAAALGGAVATALGVAAVVFAPVALILACCAAFSATADPYAYLLVPQIGYAASAAPVVGASVAVGVPALIAREAQRHGDSAIPAAAGIAIVIAVACAALVPILGQRFAKRDAAAA